MDSQTYPILKHMGSIGTMHNYLNRSVHGFKIVLIENINFLNGKHKELYSSW